MFRIENDRWDLRRRLFYSTVLLLPTTMAHGRIQQNTVQSWRVDGVERTTRWRVIFHSSSKKKRQQQQLEHP